MHRRRYAIRKAGYHAIWKGERSWNGVAILARKREPILIRDLLPGNINDRQSRYIEAAVDGIAVASIYLPNGNPQPGPKFTYKLEWFDRLIDHAAGLLSRTPRPFSRATTTWFRPTSTSLRRGLSKTTRCCSRATRGLLEAADWRLDGRAKDAPSGRSNVYLLELSQEPVAPGCRPQARSSAAEPCGRPRLKTAGGVVSDWIAGKL
jgi:hypothetical protein